MLPRNIFIIINDRTVIKINDEVTKKSKRWVINGRGEAEFINAQ